MIQMDLIPDDIAIAKAAVDRARKAKNGRINIQVARLYDAVHRELKRNYPAPSVGKSEAPAKPGHTRVREHYRAKSSTEQPSFISA